MRGPFTVMSSLPATNKYKLVKGTFAFTADKRSSRRQNSKGSWKFKLQREWNSSLKSPMRVQPVEKIRVQKKSSAMICGHCLQLFVSHFSIFDIQFIIINNPRSYPISVWKLWLVSKLLSAVFTPCENLRSRLRGKKISTGFISINFLFYLREEVAKPLGKNDVYITIFFRVSNASHFSIQCSISIRNIALAKKMESKLFNFPTNETHRR